MNGKQILPAICAICFAAVLATVVDAERPSKPAACRYINPVKALVSPLLAANVRCCELPDWLSVTRCLTLNRNKKIATDACSADVPNDWSYREPSGLFDFDANKFDILLFSLSNANSRIAPTAAAAQAWQEECCSAADAGESYDCFKQFAAAFERKSSSFR